MYFTEKQVASQKPNFTTRKQKIHKKIVLDINCSKEERSLMIYHIKNGALVKDKGKKLPYKSKARVISFRKEGYVRVAIYNIERYNLSFRIGMLRNAMICNQPIKDEGNLKSYPPNKKVEVKDYARRLMI